MMNGKLLVRPEYRNALTTLEAYHAKLPLKGGIILGLLGVYMISFLSRWPQHYLGRLG